MFSGAPPEVLSGTAPQLSQEVTGFGVAAFLYWPPFLLCPTFLPSTHVSLGCLPIKLLALEFLPQRLLLGEPNLKQQFALL